VRRYSPSPSQGRTPASAAATNPITTVRPIVAAGVVLTITAVVAVQVDWLAAWWADCSGAGDPTDCTEPVSEASGLV
jgi:hypothetical protein